ncbi:phage portal protein [Amycolatopsis sp. PS_44_ISF1]|uniref:phage portal protein n=1 Tax=Amycolatopsis sp. PS_44_ISF1 TaxID=2974917 RepID=UPI0028E00973|nr:phage portal protein [Amycolatopsis sp. PS_44_ISF1]MDT8915749.1 phage portal protein [Amycolatopsis sp. PS_44_ISF1]
MPLSISELNILTRLATQLRRDAAKLLRYGDYYEGTHHLEQLGLAIPPDLRQFVVCVNWPRITADSLEERIDLEGFRLPGKHERDADLWRIWQANNLDEESQLGHLDAIIYGRSYICIGSRADDTETPLITVESPMEMTAEISPKTREVTAALRLYRDQDEDGLVVDKATIYLPHVTIWAERRWSGPTRGWTEVDRDEHGLGRVPVVPLINRARVGDRYGVSELQDVIDLTDAAARALTLAQLATEALSVPQRAVLGAKEQDFVGPDGKVMPKWQAYFGAIWALENPEAKLFQFSAADLSNFKTIVDHYASMVSSVTGLPLRFFGQNTANPPSAEGIRADEARIVKRAERRQRSWGGAWEEAMRIVKRIVTGEWDDSFKELETIWRDPATPTRAQQADAAVKLVQANILPVEAAWEEMGYSQTRITELKRMREQQLAATDVLARQINAYRQGVTGNPGANTEVNDPAEADAPPTATE